VACELHGAERDTVLTEAIFVSWLNRQLRWVRWLWVCSGCSILNFLLTKFLDSLTGLQCAPWGIAQNLWQLPVGSLVHNFDRVELWNQHLCLSLFYLPALLPTQLNFVLWTQNKRETSPSLLHTRQRAWHAFAVGLQQRGFGLGVSRLVRQPQGHVRPGAWWGTATPLPRAVPPGPGGHGPGLLFHQHGLHLLCPCEAVLSILGWLLCKSNSDLKPVQKITAEILKAVFFWCTWCLFAGGGIRDSWHNLMEETPDAGGVYILIWSNRCKTMYVVQRCWITNMVMRIRNMY